MKRLGIITGAVLISLYVLFLILPILLSPILNSYNQQIETLIKESTGFNAKLEKIAIITTPKLTVGVGIGHTKLSLPTGETFLEADKLRAKLALLPLLTGKIRISDISAKNIDSHLIIRQDGHLLIEEYMPQPDPDNNETMTELPLGLKLSNHLPDIKIQKYNILLTDPKETNKYAISGKNFKITDFIFNKKVKFYTDGSISVNNNEQLIYKIKIFNKIMPKENLNDVVFNSTQTSQESSPFNVLDIFDAIRISGLSANSNIDLKIEGDINSPNVNGNILIDKLSLLVNNNKLPDSNISVKLHNSNITADTVLYTANDEKTTLNTKIKTGKNIDIHLVSNASLDNLFEITKMLAKTFDYNDLQTLKATGKIDADFTMQANKKHVKSNGYLKIPNAKISYGLYNLVADNINADIDFNNKLNIKNISLNILGQPLKIFGTIEPNSDTDISITANQLSLKGLLATAGQLQLLKENSVNSGTLSLNGKLTGKLTKIDPQINISLDNVDIKNIASNTKILLPNAKFSLNNNDKKYNGNLEIANLKLINPMATIKMPQAKINIGEKDIIINNAYLLLDNSRIDITGQITNYINDKLNIDLKANGYLLAQDINSMMPIKSYATGKLPLKATITGNTNTQNININLTANNSNYVSLLTVNSLKNATTIINSDIKLSNDTIKLSNTGIFANSISNPVLSLNGTVTNLSKSQNLNLRLSIPKSINSNIPGFKNSSVNLRGDIDITGTASNPYLNGLINIPALTIKDMDLDLTNLVINVKGAMLRGSATAKKIRSGAIVVNNLTSDFILKNYTTLFLNNILADAFEGKISGNVSYNLNNGKIGVNLNGSGLNSLKAVEGLSGIKNAITGLLSFKMNITTQGVSDVDLMKHLQGNATFQINDGKFLNVGRFDKLLYAQNIVANSVLKKAVTTITNVPIIQNTAEFKTISGSIKFNNGWATFMPIKTAGPMMAYYITGKYNLLNGTTNVIILGRIDSKVVAVLGPLGELSADKLLAYIPNFGSLTSSILKTLTEDPKNEHTEYIPALTTGSKNYKDFKVVFNGGIESASSVKSFKWLTKCDTSAIDFKQEYNQLKNSVQSVQQDFQNSKDMLKNQLMDSKQQLNDAKEELKNLFKF